MQLKFWPYYTNVSFPSLDPSDFEVPLMTLHHCRWAHPFMCNYMVLREYGKFPTTNLILIVFKWNIFHWLYKGLTPSWSHWLRISSFYRFSFFCFYAEKEVLMYCTVVFHPPPSNTCPILIPFNLIFHPVLLHAQKTGLLSVCPQSLREVSCLQGFFHSCPLRLKYGFKDRGCCMLFRL